MIDPRALQQHFRKVHQKERPPKQEVPRVPDPVPLTAFQAIPVPVEVIPVTVQEEVTAPIIPVAVIEEMPKVEPKKEIINLVINVPPPIDQIVINDMEDEDVSEPKETVLETSKTIEEYDPYGYYSGPKF